VKIKEIEVKIARTTNIGSYESIKNEVGVSATLGPKEDFDEQFEDLHTLAENELLAQIKKSVKRLSLTRNKLG
tara:strand:+ start:477 stop:695 length:219 start_codon:yes stop_codon:yes gene_type:complete